MKFNPKEGARGPLSPARRRVFGEAHSEDFVILASAVLTGGAECDGQTGGRLSYS